VKCKYTFGFQSWHEVAVLVGFPEKLRDDFDLLTATDEVVERDSRDTSHLDIVDEAH
jgi:hypothetical protein